MLRVKRILVASEDNALRRIKAMVKQIAMNFSRRYLHKDYLADYLDTFIQISVHIL